MPGTQREERGNPKSKTPNPKWSKGAPQKAMLGGRGLIQNPKSKIQNGQTGSEETVLPRWARERRQERTILNNSSE
jgi:hypothetical protein